MGEKNMESIFLKNLLRKENRPLLIIIVALFIFQLVFSAYLLLDLRGGKNEEKSFAQAPISVLAVKNDETQAEETGNFVSSSTEAPGLQVTATDPKTKALIEKVSAHIFLPSGNVQVETVVKPEELRQANPIFYQWVRAGDQILEYSDRAILYDPMVDKVLDVMHISK